MSDQDLARKGAKSILGRCLGLSAGSHFILLTDESAVEIVDSIFQAAQDLDIQLTTLFYTRLQQMSLTDLGNTAKRIIADADAALLAHTDATECSRFRTKLVSEWRGTTRLGTMPGASSFILESSAAMDDRFIIDQCRRLTLPLLLGHDCTITTFDHTGKPYDLHLQLGGIDRIPVQSTGILGPLAWGNVPSGEIFTAPLEASAAGDYVVNGAIGSLSLKGQEAVLTFRGGRLVEHRLLSTGEPVAFLNEVRSFSEGRRDENWNVIAEFGIGVNRGICEVTGSSLLDEKMFGSVHVAVGNNIGWQGENAAQIHLDIITKGPTVTINGMRVLERGQHVVKPEDFDNLAAYKPHPRFSWQPGVGIAEITKEPVQREEHGEILIRLPMTQSGRITEVPIANEQTRQLLSHVLRYSSDRPPTVAELAGAISPSLTVDLLYRLLSLLWTYGVVKPERR